jgi:hypothetical protein
MSTVSSEVKRKSAPSSTEQSGKKFRASKSETSRLDASLKLERSRQSARECRARKKLRYQYLEELVSKREESIQVLKKEVDSIQDIFLKVDQGLLPRDALNLILDDDRTTAENKSNPKSTRTSTVTK